MKTPAYIDTSDLIRIVAPAGKVRPGNVKAAVKMLRYEGFRVVEGKHLYDEVNQFAGTDDDRAADLQEALDDHSSRAIFMARGGYGLLRIIDRLDFSRFVRNPKWVTGFSDITVLHSHLHNLGIETIHSVMPNSFPADCMKDRPVESLLRTITGEQPRFSMNSHPLNRPGEVNASVTGGNLTLLTALLGSESETVTAGKILFIEDVGEHLYRIDRMMHSLKRAGKLDKIKGLIVGQFSDMLDGTTPFGKTAEEIIAEAVAEYSYPVAFGFPAGHDPENLAFILGRETTLTVAESHTSVIQHSGAHG